LRIRASATRKTSSKFNLGATADLLGAAVLLLGNWINRWNDRRRAEAAHKDKQANLKTLIAAELVNVAAGLIGALRSMDAAIGSAEAGAALPAEYDLSRDLPRPMPFIDSLGSELAILETRDLDVLATLRANLVVTGTSMEEISDGKRPFGWLVARQLHSGLRHDMRILSEAFEQFAPTRKLAVEGRDPELATVILTRLAAEANA
jgi:hypothetical protein